MNKEFKRMQQLAGIKEIQVAPGGGYAKVLNDYIKNTIAVQEDYPDDPELVEYIFSLKHNPPTAHSAEKAAEEIKNIDDTLTELAGAYLGEFYDESVFDPLVEMGKKIPSLRLFIRRIIETLHELYDIDDENRQDYDKSISDEWSENRIYQDILNLYIRHVYVQNFKLLPGYYRGEGWDYINSLNNYPPKVGSLEELASAIITINDKIREINTNKFFDIDELSYDGVDVTLNKIAASDPRYKSIIDALLEWDDLI